MKHATALLLCLGLIFVSFGCAENKTRVAEGSIIGGVLGAAAGAGIGSLSGNAGAGAGIGAAVGVLSGAAIGSQINKPGTGQQAAAPGQTANPNQMSAQQIIDMSKQGVNEAVIIDKIQLSNSKFNLTTAEVDNLRQQGVSQKVIDVMQRK